MGCDSNYFGEKVGDYHYCCPDTAAGMLIGTGTTDGVTHVVCKFSNSNTTKHSASKRLTAITQSTMKFLLLLSVFTVVSFTFISASVTDCRVSSTISSCYSNEFGEIESGHRYCCPDSAVGMLVGTGTIDGVFHVICKCHYV
ncbi:hypothetical protein Btru_066213 [Bulinus truncatus]|nr:hypothetical protein Btru_066213 [Bulinus truncatus]